MRMILINNTRVNTKGVDANRELNKTQLSQNFLTPGLCLSSSLPEV